MIKSLSNEELIRNLPKIVRGFAVSIKYSTASHCWNRIHRRKVTIAAEIPDEIEMYIINRMRIISKEGRCKINFGLLIDVYWHVVYRPFEIEIVKIMNKVIPGRITKNNKPICIFVEYVQRNKGRLFNPLYFGDMALALSVYFCKVMECSRIVSIPQMPDESLFFVNNNFPLDFDQKNITAAGDICSYMKCNSENRCILYICQRIGYPCTAYGNFEKDIKTCCDIDNTIVIIWELKPYIKIESSHRNIRYIQGFSEDNFIEVEKILDTLKAMV